MVDDKWSELAYKGLIYEPLYEALNAFIDTTQERVNGKVDLEIYKGAVRVLGRSSPDAIYSEDMVSFDSTSLDQCHAIVSPSNFGIQARMGPRQKNKEYSKIQKVTFFSGCFSFFQKQFCGYRMPVERNHVSVLIIILTKLFTTRS